MSVPSYKPSYAGKGKMRKSSYHRGYTKTWIKVRKRFLMHHPLCCEPDCGELATQVDHKLPIEQGGAIYDWGNLQPFCHRHHSMKTVREDGGFGREKTIHDRTDS